MTAQTIVPMKVRAIAVKMNNQPRSLFFSV